jgi:hypothetical protein
LINGFITARNSSQRVFSEFLQLFCHKLHALTKHNQARSPVRANPRRHCGPEPEVTLYDKSLPQAGVVFYYSCDHRQGFNNTLAMCPATSPVVLEAFSLTEGA